MADSLEDYRLLSGMPIKGPFSIRSSPETGRYLVATRDLPKGTTILTTGPPVLGVVMREYRKETCAFCFRYDRGRNLPVRPVETGKAFCNEHCLNAWKDDIESGLEMLQAQNVQTEPEMNCKMGPARNKPGIGFQSWVVLEELVRKRAAKDASRDTAMADVDAPRPGMEEVNAAWRRVAQPGEAIEAARTAEWEGQRPSKTNSKVLREAVSGYSLRCDPDVLSFLLAGILLRAKEQLLARLETATNGIHEPHTASPWSSLLALASTETPYPNALVLQSHCDSYLLMLAVLPFPLLQFVRPSNVRAIPKHEAHNSFGIRSLDDAGDEFLGYGVWPEASLFNHTCSPNLGKARGRSASDVEGLRSNGTDEVTMNGHGGPVNGRSWSFWTSKDVKKGDELSISYLGGEEQELNAKDRRQRLTTTWGFECRCARCVGEDER